MDDSFPKLSKAIEEIGFLLEQFDFSVHNDAGNPEHVEQAKAALEHLESAVSDLVP